MQCNQFSKLPEDALGGRPSANSAIWDGTDQQSTEVERWRRAAFFCEGWILGRLAKGTSLLLCVTVSPTWYMRGWTPECLIRRW